ncbi:hypothetical protein GQS52_15380 [Streptomyces sp. SCUT-3]|uniref:hypothetical protein n=1 Tax=Streptomyces sp. SCUT-3 TaxID=2684469 RepID=UPI000CC353D9|nr:hypothetical protein [Streptomyces sp. SCUT-3]PLW64837.1 hypothetical protein C0036_27345 [Streptomyces sp. DJ]QMV22936.1 hypothetical protein GQS52_15380 [Streptomyces sp. SCUT-3]
MPGPNVPRELPVALLQDPEMVEACRTRDFGKVFALVRRKAGIYPSRIAALCELTPSRVGEVMAGQRRLLHIDVIERVSDGLRIPGAMLGLAQRPWEAPVRSAPTGHDSFRGTFPVPPRGHTWSAELDEILNHADDGPVTRSALVAVQSCIEDYWRRDDEHGGASLRPAVVGHLRHVRNLAARTTSESLRSGLERIAAELARLAGWAYFDSCQYSTARSYFTQSLHLAQEVGDRQFVANVLSCMSLLATYEGDARQATALACAAQDIVRGTGSSLLIMAMLHMREAFAQAALQDAAACHRAVDRSHRCFERADSERAPEWVRYFDETKLVVDTGIALARLGEHRKAEPLIAQGLHRECRARQRGRAFHAFWLAATQLQQGAVEQACATAGLALDLTATVDSPRVAAHVHDFGRRLRPYAREASVIAFEARMREVFA